MQGACKRPRRRSVTYAARGSAACNAADQPFQKIELCPARVERATSAFGGQRSIQLSYGHITKTILGYPSEGSAPASSPSAAPKELSYGHITKTILGCPSEGSAPAFSPSAAPKELSYGHMKTKNLYLKGQSDNLKQSE